MSRATSPNRDGAEALLRTAEQSIATAAKLGTPNLNLHGTGLGPQGLPVRPVATVTGPMWLAAEKTLTRIAALGEREGVVFCLETSTPLSITQVRYSPRPRTPTLWSGPSTVPSYA